MKKRFGIRGGRGSAGDTIVEVMIVLAVLGLSMSISYATANHGLIQSRNAEEHSEALGLLDSQVELLRAAFSQNSSVSSLTNGTDFCMNAPPANPELSTALNHNVPTDAVSDNLYGSASSNYPAACLSNSFYNLSIHYDTTDSSNPFFDLRVRWDGLGTLGRQQEELTYKISPLSITGLPFDNGPILTAPSTPAASPPAGTYSSTQSVSLTSTGPGTPIKIYYTTDGSTPSNTHGTIYSSAITVSTSKTIKAIAYNSSNVASGVLTAHYVIALPITPHLAASGCTGPVGTRWTTNCMSGDSIAVTVTGVNSSDACVFKNDNGDNSGSTVDTVTASGSTCTDNLSIGSITSSQTGYLTAYVTDQGNSYTSNSLTFNSWPNTSIYTSCSWPDGGGVVYHDGYSNWVYTVGNDGCPSGTTQCSGGAPPAGNCSQGSPENYSANVACKSGLIYVYGMTWTGPGNPPGIPCPPGTTQVSLAPLPAPTALPPPGLQAPEMAQIAALNSIFMRGKAVT